MPATCRTAWACRKTPWHRSRPDGTRQRSDHPGQQPALSAADKKTLITEVNQIRDGLLSLANADDGTGRYVFGGTNDGDPPFAKINGKVVYRGDQTQRQVEVGPDTYVKDALPGSEIFMRIPTGDGVDGSAAAGNTGNGVLTNITRDGSDSWNGQGFSVRFTTGNQYEVVDGAGNVTGTGTYKAGDDLEVNGVRLRITAHRQRATASAYRPRAAATSSPPWTTWWRRWVPTPVPPRR